MYLNDLVGFLVRTATNVWRKYPKYSTKENRHYESQTGILISAILFPFGRGLGLFYFSKQCTHFYSYSN